MRRTLLAAVATCALLVTLAGCRSAAPTPRLDAVIPEEAESNMATSLQLQGRDFYNRLSASVEGGTPEVGDGWQVLVGSTALDPATVSRIDDTRLETVLPAGFAPGVYDLTVISPDGLSSTLAQALTVLAPALRVAGVEAPARVLPGQRHVPVKVRLRNSFGEEVPLTGLRLAFDAGAQPRDGDYEVYADPDVPLSVPALGTATAGLLVHVAATSSAGEVQLTAAVQGVRSSVGEAVEDAASASWTVAAGIPPDVEVTAPGAAGVVICEGGAVDFAAGVSGSTPFAWRWDLPGTSLALATAAAPTVSYGAIGAYPFRAEVTEADGDVNAAASGLPVFVGRVGGGMGQTFPAGPLGFETPAAGQSFDLSMLPLANAVIGTGAVLQCDGTPLPGQSTNAWVTLFVDRGALDPAGDDESSEDGVQRALDASERVPATSLLAGPAPWEGEGLLIAEFVNKSEMAVTAAGWVPFRLVGDLDPPDVAASVPEADCVAVCRGRTDPFVIRFDEPMRADTVPGAVRVEWAPGVVACGAAGFTDATADSSAAYEVAARTLTVVPAAQSSPEYTVRVLVTTSARDASLAGNPLPSFARCAVVQDLAPAASAAVPANVSIQNDPFSPDGDGFKDAASFEMDVDAATRLVRVEVVRDFEPVVTLTAVVNAAGPLAIPWDGRDATGRVVRDGHYLARITASNEAGVPSAALLRSVRVDAGVVRAGLRARLPRR